MNLIHQTPFELVRRDGSRAMVPFTQIADSQWVDIWSPRPDFRGAAFQFAIGLLQLAMAPSDMDEWEDHWDKHPDEASLSAALAPYVQAFELDSESAAFMQDGDLGDVEIKGIAGLLIESPGEKTIRDNLDHFVKRGMVEQVCPACAAMALFTLQINAPSGGVGHRVSVRGGGPLTTLLMPSEPGATLWQKLWLNVMPQDALGYGTVRRLADVLPWTGATRTSDSKGVGDTVPDAVHPLQAYWSTPRRIRLEFQEAEEGRCDLCGALAQRLVRNYRTRNYGTNYTGPWMHPLTPHTLDPKTGPLSIKGQRGGVAYRHWLGLALGNEDAKPQAAMVVRQFNRYLYRKMRVRLWCFGYDMDNMKARCWYDTTLPLHSIDPAQQPAFTQAVRTLLDVAMEAAALLNKHVKAARFKRPADVPTDPAVPQSFWQSSEPGFYALLQRLAEIDGRDEASLAGVYRSWLLDVRHTALRLYDDWVQSAPIEDGDMGRIVRQRAELLKWLNAGKVVKLLWKIVKTHHKDAA